MTAYEIWSTITNIILIVIAIVQTIRYNTLSKKIKLSIWNEKNYWKINQAWRDINNVKNEYRHWNKLVSSHQNVLDFVIEKGWVVPFKTIQENFPNYDKSQLEGIIFNLQGWWFLKKQKYSQMKPWGFIWNIESTWVR